MREVSIDSRNVKRGERFMLQDQERIVGTDWIEPRDEWGDGDIRVWIETVTTRGQAYGSAATGF